MKRLIPIFLLLLTVWACGPEKEEQPDPPEDLLSEEEFTQFLTDALIVEAAVSRRLFKEGDPERLGAEAYIELLKDYDIDQDQFKRSYNFYSSDRKLMAKIYDKVIVNLTEWQSTLKASKMRGAPKPAKPDSTQQEKPAS